MFVGVALSAQRIRSDHCFRWGTRSRTRTAMALDADLASLLGTRRGSSCRCVLGVGGTLWFTNGPVGYFVRPRPLAAALLGRSQASHVHVGQDSAGNAPNGIGEFVGTQISILALVGRLCGGNPKAGWLVRLPTTQLRANPSGINGRLSISLPLSALVPTGLWTDLRAITFLFSAGSIRQLHVQAGPRSGSKRHIEQAEI